MYNKTKHEEFHAVKKKSPAIVEQLRQRIVKKYSDAELDAIVDSYVKAYGWTNAKTADVLEEIFADAYAGIDIFTGRDVVNRRAIAYTEDVTRAVQEAEQNPSARSESNDGKTRMSIERTADGKLYVQADRQVLFGDDPVAWGRQMEAYINGKIRNGQDVYLPTADGHIVVLSKESAHKMSDRHKSQIEKEARELLEDSAYALKGRIVTHIDELIQVAKFDKYKADKNRAHKGKIGEDGFNYFTAYFMDFDGSYYAIPVSSGINNAKETAYSIGTPKERRKPTVGRGSSSVAGGALNDSRLSSGNSIYQNGQKSQEKIFGNVDNWNNEAMQEAFDRALAKKEAEQNPSTRSESNDGRTQYSLDPKFESSFDQWMSEKSPERRKVDGGYFRIGTTSEALKSIGVRDGIVSWRKQKIAQIMEDHPEITAETIKQVPNLIENPVIVMKSLTRPHDSIVLLGDVVASNGNHVFAALQLTPTATGNMEAEFSLITSAYGRSETNIQNLIRESEILYLDPNKKRTDTWLMSLRVQFPSDQSVYGSIGSISYSGKNVNIQGQKIFGNEESGSSFSRELPNNRKYGGDGIRWTVENDILTERERVHFFSRIADIKKRKHKVPRTKDGKYVIDLENKLVFTDGDWHDPLVDRVIVLLDDDGTRLAQAKGWIYNELSETGRYDLACQSVEKMFGDGYVYEELRDDYRTDEWENERGEGRNRQGALSENSSGRNRSGEVSYSRELPESALVKQNEYLRERMEYWKGQNKKTKEPTLRADDVRKLTNSILKAYDSKVDFSGVNAEIKALGEFIMRAEAVVEKYTIKSSA